MKMSFLTRLAFAAFASAIVALAAARARSAVLACEGFDYSAGTLVGANGATGWGAVWATAGPVAANSPDYTGLSETGNTGTAAFSAVASRLFGVLGGGTVEAAGCVDGSGNIGADGKTLWFSFLRPQAAWHCFLSRVSIVRFVFGNG